MDMSTITGRIGCRQSGETNIIREFGQAGKIKAAALEDGKIVVVIEGHAGLSCPKKGYGWGDEQNSTFKPPVYVTIVWADELHEILQQAHEAADAALEKETRACQVVENL